MTLSDQSHSVIIDSQGSKWFSDQNLVKVRVAQGSATLRDQSYSGVGDAQVSESFSGW